MSILCSEDGLSFTLLNKEKDKYVLIGHYRKEEGMSFQSQFEFLERFQQVPDDVSLSFIDQRYTLVPRELFQEKDASRYLNFSVEQKAENIQFHAWDDQILVYEGLEKRFEWLFDQITPYSFGEQCPSNFAHPLG